MLPSGYGSPLVAFNLSPTETGIFRESHDDVIKWKHFPRYWPFVRGIHRSPVNSPHKGQWRGVLMFSLICARINAWVNNREAGDLRCYRAHYDVTVMKANIMAADHLISNVTRSSTAMALIAHITRLCLTRGRISTTFTISVLSNDINATIFFFHSLKHIRM